MPLLTLLLLPMASASWPKAAWGADPLPYKVSIAATGNAALDAALAGSSQAIALKDRAPSAPFGVIARLRADGPRFATALESFGYFDAQTTITLQGMGLDNAALASAMEALPAGTVAQARVSVSLGPRYDLRRLRLDGPLPAGLEDALALPLPRPYVAGDILAALDRLRAALAEAGYPFAHVDAPAGTVDPAARAVDIAVAVTPGPHAVLGRITYEGLERTNASYITSRLRLKPGQPFRPSRIEAARQDLAGIGVFASVRAIPGKTLDPDGTLPLTLSFTERRLRSVTADLSYATDTGGALAATWSHHNLFGNAEQLNATLGLTGLGGSAADGIGYNGKLALIKPDLWRRGQSLEVSAQAVKQSLQAYDQTAFIEEQTLSRRFSRRISGSVGVRFIQEQITQQGETRDYTLFAIPLTLRFDSTGLRNPLDDPTGGWRLLGSIAPTQSLGGSSATFVVMQGNAATYLDAARLGLTRTAGQSVLAVRGLIGTAQGAGAFDLPPDQRFYGGGSATIRGFRYQSVGPRFANNDPQGGAAIDAASIELRQRLWGDIGAVIFADAGQVNDSSTPFGGRLEAGGGIGARYYTPIGPLRVDIAMPFNRRAGDDAFQLYIGIGQAF